MKNRYIARTFIMPGQKERIKNIRKKLSPIRVEFAGKNVLLVDDSIVRGNTAKQIVALAFEAGANRVYFASAAPPVRFPNIYGIDMPAASEYVAHGKVETEVAQELGVNWLLYQDLEDLEACIRVLNPTRVKRFDSSCFDGQYVTGDIDTDYLDQLATMRSDQEKPKQSWVDSRNESASTPTRAARGSDKMASGRYSPGGL